MIHEDDFLEMFEEDELLAEESSAFELPGRILVRVFAENPPYDCFEDDFEIISFDYDSCVFWINEGTGIDFWLSKIDIDFGSPGVYVVEGITGKYRRGTFGFDDDYEEFEYASIRPATQEEIDREAL